MHKIIEKTINDITEVQTILVLYKKEISAARKYMETRSSEDLHAYDDARVEVEKYEKNER